VADLSIIEVALYFQSEILAAAAAAAPEGGGDDAAVTAGMPVALLTNDNGGVWGEGGGRWFVCECVCMCVCVYVCARARVCL
jgi:hypothetical protein